MKRRLAKLASSRSRLLEKIESQRMEVAALARQWQTPLALADLGVTALRFLRNHPIVASGGAAALLTLRRRGIVGMVRQWWRLLRGYAAPLSFAVEFFSEATRTRRNGHDARADRREAR